MICTGMNGRLKKSRLGVSVEFGMISDKERVNLLEIENQELSLEITDLRTSLELNKNSIMEIITATTTEKEHALVVTINGLVQENMKLQNELQRVQDELLKDIRQTYADSVRDFYNLNEK